MARSEYLIHWSDFTHQGLERINFAVIQTDDGVPPLVNGLGHSEVQTSKRPIYY